MRGRSVPTLLARALVALASRAPGTASASAAAAAPPLQHHLAAATTSTRGFAAEATTTAPRGDGDGDGDAPSSSGRGGGRRRASSSSSNRRRARSDDDDHRSASTPFPRPTLSPLWEDNLNVLRGTWPVRVAPAHDAGLDSGWGGTSAASDRAPPAHLRLRYMSAAVGQALAKGPDGVMLATRADVIAFLGVEGGEAGLAQSVLAARQRRWRDGGGSNDGDDDKDDAEAAANKSDETDADNNDAPRPSSSSSSSPSYPPALLSLLLAAPELDADFRPAAWWVALPSLAARRRALSACDGKEMGAGGTCRVTPGTVQEMMAATRGGWHLPGRLASRSGGEAVLLRGLPAGGGEGGGGRAEGGPPAVTALSVRAALQAAGLELRRTKVPVRLLKRVGGGRWHLQVDNAVGEEEEDDDEKEEEEEEEKGKDAAAEESSSSRKKADKQASSEEEASREVAALVWLASPDEARRCERELHGRPLPLPGAAGAGAGAGSAGEAAAPVVSAFVLP